jgi:hypothetical protein
MIASSQEGFEKVHREFSLAQVNNRLFMQEADAGDSIFSALDFTAKYEMTRERIRQIGAYFKDKATLMATLTLQLVAGYLFDCIIFPLTFFVILYVLAKSLVTFLIRSVNYPRTMHKQSGRVEGGRHYEKP